ncbi:L-threonylcarbamoyladenylate synthase [Massiliimalia massiliensis]|uniref:L-threonylcarbamoyladenylate synthase n=1 Tax=Massiliimalia massiliensis TaxID=1852384 RepID=UPI001356606E|nr:L-threonylcarbamoyladenylate synthase [Massiliimalia massiliensis]
MRDTRVLKATTENFEIAKREILNGEVVAIPTETVYGLAANAFDETAVSKIFEAKGRPQDNPLIVHIADMEMLREVVSEVSETAEKLAKKFWGGPLTMILPKNERVPYAVTAGLETVGVRMPAHLAAREFIRYCGVPLAAPSANVSGKPSPTSAAHVFHDLRGKIDYILDGGTCEVGVESTVVKVMDDQVEILRPGKITINDLLQAVSAVTIDDGVFTRVMDDKPVASPGMKYQHYSPNANVIMVEGSLTDFCQYVSRSADEKTAVLVFEGEESLFDIPCFTFGKRNDSVSQASRLFDVLREIDQHEDIQTVFARVPKQEGVGLAVYNRLLRACGFEVVNMDRAVIVGLTGQTGAGKSMICEILRQDGAIGIVDCDVVSRDVIMMPSVQQRLVEYFGGEILLEDGNVNRKALGKRIFANEEDRIFLNSVMFPPITEQINKEVRQLRDQGYRIIVLDAPTLFESGANIICDSIVSVLADANLRQERIMERDSMSAVEAQNRMNAQKDDEFYRSRSEFIIENNGSQTELKEQVDRITAAMKEKINGN